MVFFTFHAILRSIPDKLGGVAAMGGAIVILLFVPFINTSEIRSPEFRPIYSVFFWILVADFCILGWIGQKPVEDPYVLVGALATIFYFLFFLVLMPLIGIVEKQLIRAKVQVQ